MKKRIILSFLILCLMTSIPSNAEQNYYKPAEKSEEELMMDLFLSVISPEIESAVASYYADLLTEVPIVYTYDIKILNMYRVGQYRSFQFLVTLEVTPVVGPHISVGKDLLTFDISPGNVSLKKFKHLESYALPPNWQHIKKK